MPSELEMKKELAPGVGVGQSCWDFIDCQAGENLTDPLRPKPVGQSFSTSPHWHFSAGNLCWGSSPVLLSCLLECLTCALHHLYQQHPSTVKWQSSMSSGLPSWLSGKASARQWRRLGFDPWSGNLHYLKFLLVFFLNFYFLTLFLAVFVFVAARGFLLVAVSRGYPLVKARGLLIAVASLVAEHGI